MRRIVPPRPAAEPGDDTPWSTFNDVLASNPANVTEALLQSAAGDYFPQGGSSPVSVGLALAISVIDHTVLTDVGSTAVLKSNEDLEVQALINQNYTVGAESDSESAAAVGVSVAVNVATINNTAKQPSTVVPSSMACEPHASYRTFPTRSSHVPMNTSRYRGANSSSSIRAEGPEAITKYLTGTFGAKEAFFNSWAASTSEAEKVSIAASVNVIVEENISQAIVESGVLINQDASWHNPSDANDHGNQAEYQSDGNGEEVVSIEATNYAQLINMTGIFSLPSLDIDPSVLTANFQGPSAFGGQGGKKAAQAAPCSSVHAPISRRPSFTTMPRSTAARTAAST